MNELDYVLCGLGVLVCGLGAVIGLCCLLAGMAAEEGEQDDIVRR